MYATEFFFPGQQCFVISGIGYDLFIQLSNTEELPLLASRYGNLDSLANLSQPRSFYPWLSLIQSPGNEPSLEVKLKDVSTLQLLLPSAL